MHPEEEGGGRKANQNTPVWFPTCPNRRSAQQRLRLRVDKRNHNTVVFLRCRGTFLQVEGRDWQIRINRGRVTSHRYSFVRGTIADYCATETPLKKIYVYDSVLQLSGPHKKANKMGEWSTTSDTLERMDNEASLAEGYRLR